MIEIKIRITDVAIPGDREGRHYGRIEAMPRNKEGVTDHERVIRDMIMSGIKVIGEWLAKQEGISGAFIAEVPVRKEEEEDGEDSHTGRS